MAKQKFKSDKPIKDKTAVEIINMLCDIFPNAKGFYIPASKAKPFTECDYCHKPMKHGYCKQCKV